MYEAWVAAINTCWLFRSLMIGLSGLLCVLEDTVKSWKGLVAFYAVADGAMLYQLNIVNSATPVFPQDVAVRRCALIDR